MDEEDDFEREELENTDPPEERRPIGDKRLYELATAAYMDFPGQHAKVSALVSPESKRPVSAALVRLWWLRGLPSLGLPPIAEAIKNAARASMGEAPEATVSIDVAAARTKFRKLSRGALARTRETKVRAEVEKERIGLERDKVRAELARAEADKARAEAELAKQKAVAAVAAGEISETANSLMRMKAKQLQISGGIRDQTIYTIGIMNKMLSGLGALAPKIEEALREAAEGDLEADKGLMLLRRGISTLKDFSELAERNVRLDNLINGEPTERHQLTVDHSDPVATILAAMAALQASAERGGVELTEEQRALMSAVDVEAVTTETDSE